MKEMRALGADTGRTNRRDPFDSAWGKHFALLRMAVVETTKARSAVEDELVAVDQSGGVDFSGRFFERTVQGIQDAHIHDRGKVSVVQGSLPGQISTYQFRHNRCVEGGEV